MNLRARGRAFVFAYKGIRARAIAYVSMSVCTRVSVCSNVNVPNESEPYEPADARRTRNVWQSGTPYILFKAILFLRSTFETKPKLVNLHQTDNLQMLPIFEWNANKGRQY